jgi:hypothetical protein
MDAYILCNNSIIQVLFLLLLLLVTKFEGQAAISTQYYF